MRAARALLPYTAILVIGIALVAPSPASAEERPDGISKSEMKRAKRHFKKGEKLFALGRFDKALEQYESAFEEAPLPEFLFNIGQCQRNLGDYDGAIFSYRKYLKLKPDARNRESVEKLIDELEIEIENEDNRPDLVAPPPKKKRPKKQGRPFYKHWAFWTGVVVVAAGATTAAIVVSGGTTLPESDLGNLDFGK
jgi:tetratricopeptide (TPR) repeat protein